jgi:hypothetical protein
LSFPFLQQGTATNIRNYFGLVWQTTSPYVLVAPNYWMYAPGAFGSALATTPVQGAIADLDAITAREPNFIELLKAAIHAGALGKSTGNPAGIKYEFETSDGGTVALRDYIVLKDSSIDCQVIQIAANIIEQAGLDAFPKRIIYDDFAGGQSNPRLFTGVENLPYLYRTANIPIYARKPNPMGTSYNSKSTTAYFGSYPVAAPSPASSFDPGSGVLMIVPEIWNPHDQNGQIAGGVLAGATTSLRPGAGQLRVVADDTDPSTAIMALDGTNSTPVSSLTLDNYGVSGATSQSANSTSFVLNPQTSELDFGDDNGLLFREPTALRTPNVPTGSYLTTGTGNELRLDPLLKGSGSNGYLTDYRLPALMPAAWPANDANFVGIYMGDFPLAAVISGTTVNVAGANTIPGAFWEVYHDQPELTFRMQCKDAFNNWVDYDVKSWANIQTQSYRYAGAYYDGGTGLMQLIGDYTNNKTNGCSAVIDPRTGRFGMEIAYNNVPYPGGNPYRNQILCPNGVQALWNNLAGTYSNVLGTKRPAYDTDNGPTDSLLLGVYNPVATAGFFGGGSNTTGGSDDGLYSVNKTTSTEYYEDADGIVRNGMAAYTSGSSDIGLPTSTASASWASGTTTAIAQSQSRPLILHRPFKSVAELGYVFSDTPWKNIDFFTPQSGDSALLDVFCTHDPTSNNPLVAGKVNLNTRQPRVLQAVLAGAYRDEIFNLASPPAYSLPALSGSESGSVAAALVARTTGTAAGTGPLTNIGDLVGIPVTSGSFVGLSGTDLTAVYTASYGASTAASVVQRMREAAIRPLAQVGSTRVWNLMIDVVAQTGRYPLSATSAVNPLAAFLVEGEQHYWVHVAIDRATGQVLDKQVEVVKE